MKEINQEIDTKKLLRILGLPAILIIYGWAGIILLGIWIKILVETPIHPNPIIKSTITFTAFTIPTLIWLYIWRKIAKHYRNKILQTKENTR